MINFSKKTLLCIICVVLLLVAGAFAYEWWQIKGELTKQIEENASLSKQIDELQKEIEELKSATDKTTEWKTYRNEEYGFEIDYPAVGWEFKESYRGSPTLFSLCKQQDEEQKEEEEFCIFYTIEPMFLKCYSLSWEEIMENAFDCFSDGFGIIQFKGEIITDSGTKGYKGKGRSGTEAQIGVFFLIPGKLLAGGKYHTVLFLHYNLASFLNPDIIYPYALEKDEILNQMVQSFRFIEE